MKRKPKALPRVSETVTMRFHVDTLAEVEKWMARQPDRPTRNQAIVRLTAIGLKVEKAEFQGGA